MSPLNYLDRLESEAIQIIRDGVAEAEHPVLLFSGGKDSTVLAHLAKKAFYPSRLRTTSNLSFIKTKKGRIWGSIR